MIIVVSVCVIGTVEDSKPQSQRCTQYDMFQEPTRDIYHVKMEKKIIRTTYVVYCTAQLDQCIRTVSIQSAGFRICYAAAMCAMKIHINRYEACRVNRQTAAWREDRAVI